MSMSTSLGGRELWHLHTGDDDDFVLDSGLAGAGGDFGDGREELGGESFNAVLGF